MVKSVIRLRNCAGSCGGIYYPNEQTLPILRPVFDEGAVTGQLMQEHVADGSSGLKREFRLHIHEKAQVVQSIAAFLLAHVDFEKDFADQLSGLVENTLAFSMGDEGAREELRILFEQIADTVKDNAGTPEARVLLRRSPLSAEKAIAANEWIAANMDALVEAIDDGDLFERVFKFAMERARPDAFAKCRSRTMRL